MAGWSFTPPDQGTTANGWSFTPPAPAPQPLPNDADHDPLASVAAGQPTVRDETPVVVNDGGQQVTVPAWSLGTKVQAPAPAPSRFDFMADTANLRPQGPDPFDLTPEQKNLIGGTNPYSPQRLLVDYGLSPVTQIVNRLQTGLGDTINIASRAITGQDPNAQGNGQSVAENIMDYLPALGLEATHVPEGYLTPATKADIAGRIRAGATTEEILKDHPNLDPRTVDANVRAVKQGYKGPVSFDEPEHTDYSPDELSGKRPATQPPVKPTVDTTHVDPISETDETGTYHPINVRDPDTGDVVSAGRAYVDPDTGAPQGSVLAHPLTKENHVVTPEAQGVIESKLPGGDPTAHLTPSDTSVTPPIKSTFEARPLDDGSNIGGYSVPPDATHGFKYTTSDGKVVEGGYRINNEGEMHSLSIGDIDDPVNLGYGETMNLMRHIANEHPEIDTIYAQRQTGANPGRAMVIDAQKLRDRTVPGGTTEFESQPVEDQTQPQTQTTGTAIGPANEIVEPYEEKGLTGGGNGGGNGGNTGTAVGPEGEPEPQGSGEHMRINDTYAGSINKDKVSNDPDLRNAYDEWARTTAAKDKDGFAEINEKTKGYLNDHNDPDSQYTLFDGPRNPRDLAPWSEAVRVQTYAMAQKLARVGFDGLTEDEKNQTRAMFNLADDSAYGQGSAFRARQRQIDQQSRLATGGKTGDFDNGVTNADVQSEIDKLGVNNPDGVKKILSISAEKEPDLVDLFRKGYISGLVSNLANHVKIYGGQLAQYGLNFLSDAGTAVAGQPLRFVPGTERLYGTQMASRAIGFADGLVNAINNRAPGLFSDESSGSASLVNLKSDLMNSSFMKRPGYNTADAFLSAPLKLLHATGDFVKDVFATSYLWDEAARVARTEGKSLLTPQDLWQRMAELRDQPTPEMLKNVDKQTKIDTFRDDMGPVGQLVSKGAQGLEAGINKAWGTDIPYSTLIAPFNGIVDGVMRAGVRWGPLATLDRYNIQGFREGGIAGQKTVGRLAVASGLTGLLMQYVLGDQINGANPVNGAPANSIKVGDNWYTIKGQSAIADNALLLANARDALKENQDTSEYSTKVYNVFKSMASTVLDESTIKDLTPFLAPMDKANGEYRMRNYVTGLPVQAVPYNAALREYTRSNQPYETDTIAPNATDEALNKVKAIIPGAADSLPARLDVYGRPMPSQSGPFKTVAAETDPAVQEVNRLNVVANKKIVSPAGKVWTAYDEDDNPVKVKFTPEQLREYQQKSGDYIRRDFQDLINSPDYQTMNDKEKIKSLHNVIQSQRQNARDEILDRDDGPVGGSWSFTPPTNTGWSFSPPKQRANK